MKENDKSTPRSLAPRVFGLFDLLPLWFMLSRHVSRKSYILSGFGLMTLKYVVEATVIFAMSGKFYAPLIFLSPLFFQRQEMFANTPSFVAWGFFIWTMPFLWISVSMSVRRSFAATGSAAFGLAILLPGINYLFMLLLCFLPTVNEPENCPYEPSGESSGMGVRSALAGILVSVVFSLVIFLVAVYVFGSYGTTLFLGVPILIGVATTFLYNQPDLQSLGKSIAVSELALLIACGCLLLFAAEGAICVAMLLPFAVVMTALGGLIGYAMASTTISKPTTFLLPLALIFPTLLGADAFYRSTPLYEVESSIIINAPPEEVWPNVVGFSDLESPPTWYFELGIAYPVRATIEGEGVGAIRRCEFSTGAFVEPITVWDKPNRLAFEVESQPPPMTELSPYQHVHPPHLDGYLRSQRGEFRLVRIPGNRTRLEGSTWYEFEMYPQGYWTLWSDWSIHRIHLRVLEHIKDLSENPIP